MTSRPAVFAALTVLTLSLTVVSAVDAQWSVQHPATTAGFRGLSVVSPDVVWASGTRGTFMWTRNGGAEWHVGSVPGASSLDFRAVHAFSLDTAVLMAAGQDTARIYITTDRGAHWSLRYEDYSKGAFLDGIAFFDRMHGLVLGDPIGGHFTLLETADGGMSWHHAEKGLPPSLAGEGAFAASNTALVTCGARTAWFATGGASVSRVFRTSDRGMTWSVSGTPVQAGQAAAGIFSLACTDAQHGVAVGGNYSKPDASVTTVATTSDGGVTWTASPASPVTGYLSGVAFTDKSGSTLVGVGTEGTAFSRDGGRSWARLDTLSLNVIASGPAGPGLAGLAWAAGGRGLVTALSGLVPRGPVTGEP